MRTRLAVLLLAALAASVCAASAVQGEEATPWETQVQEALRTPPGHPRRVMLVFPLVEEGSKDGAIGWGRGLIAMQAMWRSSFAPDRLLDTWDFWVQGLYADQQLVGPGRTVTAQKIDNVCASFECPNYVTGTLKMDGDTYTAVLELHGEHGEQAQTFTAPRDQVHRLPCRIAQALVDYLGVEVTPQQRQAMAEPPLPSAEQFDTAADHYQDLLPDDINLVSSHYWEDLAKDVPTQWTADAQLQDAATSGPGYAGSQLQKLRQRAGRETALFTQAALDWDRAEQMEGDSDLCDVAAHSALALVRADPFDPLGLQWLVRALGGSGHPDLADAALDRYDLLYGKGVMASYHRGATLDAYAWDGRGAGWASEVNDEQWKKWFDRLPKARAALEWVIGRDPRVWRASEKLIDVGMGLGEPADYVEARFAQAVKACPTDYTAYHDLLFYYTPKWGGSDRRLLDVGRRAAATGLYRAGIPFVLLEAYEYASEWPDADQRDQNLRKSLLSPDVRLEVEKMLDGAEEAGVEAPDMLNMRLLYAYWDSDRDAVTAALKRMKDPFRSGEYLYDPSLLTEDQIDAIRDWAENALPPLLEAARVGNIEDLNALVEQGADLNQKDGEGRTALHLAARYGNLAVLNRLLHAGADVDARDAAGATPLVTACDKLQTAAATALIRAGADVSLADSNGNTPLHLAARGAFPEVVRLLIAHHAPLEVLNKKGKSPLHMAVTYDFEQQNVLILLEAGADPNVKDTRGQTPLHYAAAFGRMVDLRVLLAHGAKVNVADSTGITPLHRAAAHGQTEAAKELLDHGAAIGPHDQWGRTALHWAADDGSVPTLKLLLDRGADPQALDNNRHTPAELAAEKGNAEAAQLLRHAAAPPAPATPPPAAAG